MSNNNNTNPFTYLFRQLVDNPLAFISLVALGGIVYLYQDMRNFMMAQTQAFQEFTVALKEQNVRIQHLEQFHLEQMRKEGDRLAPNPTTNTTSTDAR